MPDPLFALARGPMCGHCGGPAVVHWLRRPTEAEHANTLGAHRRLAADALAAADADGPAPVIGPEPAAETSTVIVYACAAHSLDLEAAARVHAAGCGAPHPDHLPRCDCEPESTPAPAMPRPTVTLPTGWAVPAATVS